MILVTLFIGLGALYMLSFIVALVTGIDALGTKELKEKVFPAKPEIVKLPDEWKENDLILVKGLQYVYRIIRIKEDQLLVLPASIDVNDVEAYGKIVSFKKVERNLTVEPSPKADKKRAQRHAAKIKEFLSTI